MLEPGSFHLLAEKAESNACFSTAVQFLPDSTVGWLWHRNVKQFAQGHSGRECGFFCQPHWFPVSHLKACIFLGHSRHKAAGRCIENGWKILTRVMIMPDDLGQQVGPVCMLLFSGYQSSNEAYSLLLPIPCYSNRLPNLSFCLLWFIKNMINQISCNEAVYFKSGISGGGFLATGWVCNEEESMVIKKLGFYWDV